MKKLNQREQQKLPTLRFLELDQAKMAMTGSVRSAGSRRCYEHAGNPPIRFDERDVETEAWCGY